MRCGSPIDSLASALYSALIRDLPDIKYTYKRPGKDKDGKEYEPERKTRRPHEDDVEVTQFLQMWGSTALGFGGLGGQAMTSAYTTVVSDGISAAVYFAGKKAYVIKETNSTFWEDVKNHSLRGLDEGVSRYTGLAKK